MIEDRLRFKVWVKQDLEGGILRRGWLKDQCDWYHLQDNGCEVSWGGEYPEEPLILGSNVEVVFCTGVNDDNNRMIWEGDVAKMAWDYISVISFQGGSYMVGVGRGQILELSQLCSSIEIIGNKYENPELLS